MSVKNRVLLFSEPDTFFAEGETELMKTAGRTESTKTAGLACTKTNVGAFKSSLGVRAAY